MVSPSGTYDALAFPIALPKRLVNAMLPDWLKDQFLPIPDAVWSTLDLQKKGNDGEEAHIIVVQLGYQTGTGVGPSVMRLFSFHEAKIDIPYLKHYYRRDVTEDSAAFAYKQVIIFGMRLMAISGHAIPGSRSLFGSFGPDTTPSSYGEEPAALEYNIANLLSAKFSRDSSSEDEGAQWHELQELLTMPWFGGRTGKIAVEFHFDWKHASALPPRSYNVKTSLTPEFLGVSASEFAPVEVSTKAWRYKAPYKSLERQAVSY